VVNFMPWPLYRSTQWTGPRTKYFLQCYNISRCKTARKEGYDIDTKQDSNVKIQAIPKVPNTRKFVPITSHCLMIAGKILV